MKNLLSIIAFAFVMMLSVQSISAQALTEDETRPEIAAKGQVAQLQKQLDLTGDQTRTLYRAYVSKEVNYREQVNGKDINNSQVAANKKKIDNEFMGAMKATLTAEQYKKWLNSIAH